MIVFDFFSGTGSSTQAFKDAGHTVISFELPVVANLPRRTVTYCTYGDTRMKPTDLWGTVANWVERTPCKNGMTCHEAAPRGSSTGTQGIKGARDRSRVPYSLGQEILEAIEQ